MSNVSRNKHPGSVRPEWVPPGASGAFATHVRSGVVPADPAGLRRNRGAAPPKIDPEEIVEGIVHGERAALARGITLVESNAPAHRPAARALITLLTDSGRSPAKRIGISGVPGAGKSTFIEAFGNLLCDRGHRVAVLAVDPSSSVSRGSILGDKTRMETLSRRLECFIRPSPNGGALGGVTRKTRETILLCEAAGYDPVIVETVGVGQSEIAVRSMVDCFLLLLIAGAGDELQGMKKGIFEIADLVAVNKADGKNRPSALAARAEFERVLHFLSPATPGWKTPVLSCSALQRIDVDTVWDSILRYFKTVDRSGLRMERRRLQEVEWWRSMVDHVLRERFFADAKNAELGKSLEREILEGRLPASLAAERFVERCGAAGQPRKRTK